MAVYVGTWCIIRCRSSTDWAPLDALPPISRNPPPASRSRPPRGSLVLSYHMPFPGRRPIAAQAGKPLVKRNGFLETYRS